MSTFKKVNMNIVDSLVLNPKSDFGFKDMKNGTLLYLVGQIQHYDCSSQKEASQKLINFFKAGDHCFSFLQSFDFTQIKRLHPILMKLYVDSNGDWFADVRFFTKEIYLNGCDYCIYKNIEVSAHFLINGQDIKSLDGSEEVAQYITNIGLKFKLNKELTLYENMYQITGGMINYIDVSEFNKKIVIKFSEFKSAGEYFIKVIEPKLAQNQFITIEYKNDNVHFFIENKNLSLINYKCCKSSSSSYLTSFWKNKYEF